MYGIDPFRASIDTLSRKPIVPALLAPQAEKATPYVAPDGFEAGTLEKGTKLPRTLNDLTLAGKQIWYITAPASVSMSAIKNISLPQLKSGRFEETSVHIEGHGNYAIVRENLKSKGHTQVLVPDGSIEYQMSMSIIPDNVIYKPILLTSNSCAACGTNPPRSPSCSASNVKGSPFSSEAGSTATRRT
jgi:hypothetical protein